MTQRLNVSVVTAVYNRRETISQAMDSVASQTHEGIEYIVVDGQSTDGTSDIINQFSGVVDRAICEPDQGIYDALNKGINAATGDVVGFLHADDLFADNHVISRVAEKFSSGNFDAVYGDLVYVDVDDPNRIVRYWKSGEYNRRKFRRGWMPPHPTVYIRKEIYEQLGFYRIDWGSAADYECMIRLLYKHRIRVGYIPNIQVKMRVGGESNASIRNRLNANNSDRNAWQENGLKPPIGLRLTKPLSKIPQYWQRP
ncbi:MAG: glycosyltransferase family 2 protein [Planctomycetota bacterium]